MSFEKQVRPSRDHLVCQVYVRDTYKIKSGLRLECQTHVEEEGPGEGEESQEWTLARADRPEGEYLARASQGSCEQCPEEQ